MSKNLRIVKSPSLVTGTTTAGGTANTVAKFTAAQVLANSSITDDGTTIGLGGAAGATVTEATGELIFLGDHAPTATAYSIVANPTNNLFSFNVPTGKFFRFSTNNTNRFEFFNGHISTFAGISTAGLGVPAIYGFTKQKNETGVADANVLTYTPPAVAGSYRLSMSLDVSASTAGICGWTATWTDSNGHAQTPTNIIMFASGVLAGGLTLTVAANGHYFGYMDIDIDNSASNIVIQFTYTSGTLAAKMSARVEQLG